LGRVDSLVKVREETQIRTSRLSDELQQQIKALVEQHNGELLSIDNPTTTLEDLFLKVVRESEAHPGRRVRAAREP
jgi:ABC-2 type transport system ATP-binding protein